MFFAAQSALAWAPFYGGDPRAVRAKTVLSRLLEGETLTYASMVDDSRFLSQIPDAGAAFSAWFDNVLQRGADYENFEEVFGDILDVLRRKDKFAPSAGGGQADFSFTFSRESRYIQENCADGPDILRFQAYGCLKVNEVFVLSPIYETKIVLPHEIGHILGFGDLDFMADKNADLKHKRASGRKKSLMNSSPALTCDDADGLIGMLDEAAGVPRTFESFCKDGSGYIDGQYTKNYHGVNKKQLALIKALARQQQAIKDRALALSAIFQ